MVTRTVPKPGAKKPKPVVRSLPTSEREAAEVVAGFDVDERRAFEDWKREEERNRPAWKNPTKEELEVEYLEQLKEKSRKGRSGGRLSKKKWTDCGDQKPKIDMETLADKVFQRLIFEARLERERIGWAG